MLPIPETKFAETLQSRKFWMTVSIMILSLLLFLGGQIDTDTMLGAMTIAGGIYVGSLGIQDGFKQLGPLLFVLLDAIKTPDDE